MELEQQRAFGGVIDILEAIGIEKKNEPCHA